MTPQPRRISFVPQLVAGLVAAAALFVAFTLPPRAVRLSASAADARVVWGGFHIHSNRSDGSGNVDDIAAAAARAGLQYIVITDHGDATRAPDPPQYRHGVLCVDAVEISTAGGHVVAMGLKRAAPFPLAGEAADVVEDVHRFGGWAVAAHPDSPKPDLRWRGPASVPYDAIEWLNIDSEWRDDRGRLAMTLAHYFVRGPETIAALFQRPTQTLRRWDGAQRLRPVVTLAALDAHARLAWRTARDGEGRTLAALPSYVQMFRTLAQAALLDRPFSGNAASDQDILLSALRAGRSYSAVTAYAVPAQLTFFATSNDATFEMGDRIGSLDTATAWHAGTNDRTTRLALVHNGVEVASGRGTLDATTPVTAGSYRIEAYRPGLPVPWLLSNPIFAGVPPPAPAENVSDALDAAVRSVSVPPDRWAIEKNAASTARLARAGVSTQLSFALNGGAAYDQYAAMSAAIDDAASTEGFDRVQFTIRAERPMRLSLQLRLPAGPGHDRWRHSLYADETARTLTFRLQDFQPADLPTSQRPIVAHVRGVLFVIDTLNNLPSSRGAIWVSDVKLGVGKVE